MAPLDPISMNTNRLHFRANIGLKKDTRLKQLLHSNFMPWDRGGRARGKRTYVDDGVGDLECIEEAEDSPTKLTVFQRPDHYL